MDNPEKLHDIAKSTFSAKSEITNNNVAQSPIVGEADLTKSQVGGDATSKLRSTSGYNGTGTN